MEIDIKPLQPGDADWLVEQHQRSYAASDGFDASFGEAVAAILAAFEAEHDPAHERAFIAWRGDHRLGSIFCVRLDVQTAKLRLFLVLPEARGQGLGARLLKTCMGWARARGYRKMELWTHESHRAATALYAKAGWTCTASRPIHNYGVDLVEQIWQVDLDAPGVW